MTKGVADLDETTAWLTAVRTFCEKNAITWTYWQYTDWVSEKMVRAEFEARGMDYEKEAYKYYDFGARLAFDTDWRHHILKGLGLE